MPPCEWVIVLDGGQVRYDGPVWELVRRAAGRVCWRRLMTNMRQASRTRRQCTVVLVAAVIVGNNVARLVVPGQDLALAVELELPI